MKKNTLLTLSIISLVAMTGLTGCQHLKPKQKLNNHSLDYTKTRKLDPVQLPANAQTQAFVPLYTVPEMGTNTLKITNAKSKNYELPRPHTATQTQ